MSKAERLKDSHLRSSYGIGLVEYQQMFKQQDGRCAICKKPQKNRALSVDHDHKTEKVRSLLCHIHNVGIGAFQDSPELLEAAAQYLRAHRQWVPAQAEPEPQGLGVHDPRVREQESEHESRLDPEETR